MNRKERRAQRAKGGRILRRHYASGTSLEIDKTTGEVSWRLAQVDFDRFTLEATTQGLTLEEYLQKTVTDAVDETRAESTRRN